MTGSGTPWTTDLCSCMIAWALSLGHQVVLAMAFARVVSLVPLIRLRVLGGLVSSVGSRTVLCLHTLLWSAEVHAMHFWCVKSSLLSLFSAHLVATLPGNNLYRRGLATVTPGSTPTTLELPLLGLCSFCSEGGCGSLILPAHLMVVFLMVLPLCEGSLGVSLLSEVDPFQSIW